MFATSREISRLQAAGDGQTITSVAVNTDCTRALAGSFLWDIATGKQIAKVGKSDQSVFNGKGTRLAMRSVSSLPVLNGASGVQVLDLVDQLRAPNAFPRDMTFDPAGTRIAVNFSDGTIVIWPIFDNTQQLIDHVKASVGRCLTAGQRQDFYLTPEPPFWCIEMGKWPYNTEEWKLWLADKRNGRVRPLPSAIEQ
jgi:hypothetical protein